MIPERSRGNVCGKASASDQLCDVPELSRHKVNHKSEAAESEIDSLIEFRTSRNLQKMEKCMRSSNE